MRAAVAMGADVNELSGAAWPLMTYCGGRGCLEAVKACLAAGAEVEAVGKSWGTALVHAGRGGHEAVVEALLEAGASVAFGPDGRYDTLVAVCEGYPTPGIVRRLAEVGADVESLDWDGSALSYAAGYGNLAVMEVLVELGANVTATDAYDGTAMHWAKTGEVVRWLAAQGASVQGNGGQKKSPLSSACELANVDVVRTLIELGADVDFEDVDGRRPLHRAMCCGEEHEAVELARLLLAAGADADAVDGGGKTPLHSILCAGCVDVLVEAGADPEARDTSGKTPIYNIATNNELATSVKSDIVLRMADRGADLVNTGGEPGLVMRRVEELRASATAARPTDPAEGGGSGAHR